MGYLSIPTYSVYLHVLATVPRKHQTLRFPQNSSSQVLNNQIISLRSSHFEIFMKQEPEYHETDFLYVRRIFKYLQVWYILLTGEPDIQFYIFYCIFWL